MQRKQIQLHWNVLFVFTIYSLFGIFRVTNWHKKFETRAV